MLSTKVSHYLIDFKVKSIACTIIGSNFLKIAAVASKAQHSHEK
jgi:hypothetical protein